jgi:4-hydroxy-L-threonine phosphate dehydrogenase PdxA
MGDLSFHLQERGVGVEGLNPHHQEGGAGVED